MGHTTKECDLKWLEDQIAHLQIRANIMRHPKQANLLEDAPLDSSNNSDHSAPEEVHLLSHVDSSPSWYLHSGASNHVTGDKTTLDEFSPSSSSRSSIATVDGAKLSVVGHGTTSLEKNKTMTHILYVLGVTKNLLSIGKLIDDGHLVLFGSSGCLIFDHLPPHRIVLCGVHDSLNSLFCLTFLLMSLLKIKRFSSPLLLPVSLL